MSEREDKYLTYRGRPEALVSLGSQLGFVTTFPDDLPSSFYRLDLEKAALTAVALPIAARVLVAASDASDATVWAAGTGTDIFQVTAKAKTPKRIATGLDGDAVVGLVLVAGNRLGVLTEKALAIVDPKSGKVVQLSLIHI